MIVEKSNSLGVLVNGTWNGMRGRLQRGVSDKEFLLDNFEITYSLLKKIKFLTGS